MKKFLLLVFAWLFLLLAKGIGGEYSIDSDGNVAIRGTGQEISSLLPGIPDTATGVDIFNMDSAYITNLGVWLKQAHRLSRIALDHCHPDQIATVLDSLSHPENIEYLILLNIRNMSKLPNAIRGFTGLDRLTIASCNIHSLPPWLFDLPMLASIYFEDDNPGRPVQGVYVNTSVELVVASHGMYQEFGKYTDSLYQATGISISRYNQPAQNNLGYRSKVELLTHHPERKVSISSGDVLVLLSKLISDARERAHAFDVSQEQAHVLRHTSYVDKVLHIEEYDDHFVLEGIIRIKGLLAKRLRLLIQRNN